MALPYMFIQTPPKTIEVIEGASSRANKTFLHRLGT